MTPLPAFSPGDDVAPYQSYQGVCRLIITAGATAMPLAYKATPLGQAAKPTARLLQLMQPQAIITVEWQGSRTSAKPEPPKIVVPGSFILAEAGGQCSGPNKNAQLQDILKASGFLVLYTSVRPEAITLPAFWFPWDGRYNSNPEEVPQYLYTPEELGFGKLLPGYTAPVSSLKHGTGNPVAQSNTNVMFL